MTDRQHEIRRLWKRRPVSRLLRWNLFGALLLIPLAWWLADVEWGELLSSNRWEDVQRFAGDIYPYPLRDRPFDARILWAWVSDIWQEGGGEACATTLAISVAAIFLAGLLSVALILPASRNVACPEPFLPAGKPPGWLRRWSWWSLVVVTRGTMIAVRSVPEYILAFLFIALLGPNAWPAILALAIHNFGILGKLGAEIVENVDPQIPRTLRAQGHSRAQIACVALFPASLAKFLLYFFYRWETCIREATVLGMLGISSIGYWIYIETRPRDLYDEMMLFVLMSAALVLAIDLLSAITRWYIRRS